jgi:hypothetical protein
MQTCRDPLRDARPYFRGPGYIGEGEASTPAWPIFIFVAFFVANPVRPVCSGELSHTFPTGSTRLAGALAIRLPDLQAWFRRRDGPRVEKIVTENVKTRSKIRHYFCCGMGKQGRNRIYACAVVAARAASGTAPRCLRSSFKKLSVVNSDFLRKRPSKGSSGS